MTFKRGLGGVALIVPLLLGGCADGSDGETSVTDNSRSDRAAPSEALTPTPSIHSGDDPRSLLRPGGDLDRLRLKVSNDLRELESMHVEQVHSAGPETLSYNVDDKGRCSGSTEIAGDRNKLVTTSDGRVLLMTDRGDLGRRPAGRWIESPSPEPGDYCRGGPMGVVLRTARITGPNWLLADAKRIGADRLSGWETVHFRQTQNSVIVDSWIAPDGPTTRVLKLVTRNKDDGLTITQRFSRFDGTNPVAPEPPRDAVLPPGTNPA